MDYLIATIIAVPGDEPKASHILDKFSNTELHP